MVLHCSPTWNIIIDFRSRTNTRKKYFALSAAANIFTATFPGFPWHIRCHNFDIRELHGSDFTIAGFSQPNLEQFSQNLNFTFSNIAHETLKSFCRVSERTNGAIPIIFYHFLLTLRPLDLRILWIHLHALIMPLKPIFSFHQKDSHLKNFRLCDENLQKPFFSSEGMNETDG